MLYEQASTDSHSFTAKTDFSEKQIVSGRLPSKPGERITTNEQCSYSLLVIWHNDAAFHI